MTKTSIHRGPGSHPTLAVLATLPLALSLAGCPSSKPPSTLSSSESWCPNGFEVGPQDTCFAVPETTTRETPVLVYLHGPYAGHGSAEEWSLVHSAVAKGFAVVIPRGRRGLCAWTAEVKDHFCWPQEVDDPQAFKNVIAEWDRVLWQVDAIMEGPPHKKYVLGFSNGASFAAYAASHGLFPAQAWAMINGGPLGTLDKPPPRPPPLLLVAAQEDTAQAPKMKELHDGLAKTGWAHAFCARPGPHPLAATDVDAAIAFFKRDAEGSLKPAGGSFACEGGATDAKK